MTDEKVQLLKSARTSIVADRTQQSEITSRRRIITQDNAGKLNDYYAELTDILTTGKSLYRHSDAAKIKDYTFSELLKRVRVTVSAKTKPE